jgi:ABC-type sugar transport system ATPase subunit
VAIGRAIVREPQVFLFDEPLSNLDAKLRGHMRAELALLHQRLGKTTLYVTHDQVEAMTLASRIVIFDKDTTTAALRGQGAPIEGGSTSALIISAENALTTAPAEDDTFTIY